MEYNNCAEMSVSVYPVENYAYLHSDSDESARGEGDFWDKVLHRYPLDSYLHFYFSLASSSQILCSNFHHQILANFVIP